MNREQAFLLLLLAGTAVASFLILIPFLQWVLAALLLGYILRPVHCRLEPHVGTRPAAISSIIFATIAIVLPLAYISLKVYRDARQLARGKSELQLLQIEAELEELTGEEFEFAQTTSDVTAYVGDFALGNAPEIISYITYQLLGIALVLFLVYYVLIDGPDFVQWAVYTVPLDDDVAKHLVGRMDRMTWGVVAGHIFVAIVQGLIGGVGLWLVGIPNAAFWTTVMIITALLPVIGAFLVWGPAVGYLYLVGDVRMALLLFLWGFLVVSLVDNYLRSIAIDQSADVNPGVILVGVVGGIYTLGAVGLFVGPLIIGLFAAMVRAFDAHYDALANDTPPPDPRMDGRLSWIDTESASEDDSGGNSSQNTGT